MKPEFKLVTILLGILGILDLAAVPFMIAADHHTHGTPPGQAIVLAGVIGVATLISAFGVARGLRWAFWVAMTCRIIDAAQNFLGLTNHPTPVTTVAGGVGLVLSLAAIVLLIRVNPRRKAELRVTCTPRHGFDGRVSLQSRISLRSANSHEPSCLTKVSS